MAAILYKWLFVFTLLFPGLDMKENFHPVYLSVTEIEHNAKEKTLEISCKIYTDDFEKTLRMHYPNKIDLMNDAAKPQMGPIVNEYIQKHFSVKADGKAVALQFLGYEKQEEGIVSFFQANNIAAVKKIEVFDNLLYEYKEQQIGIVHVTVNGNRKSTKLNNPDASVVFEF